MQRHILVIDQRKPFRTEPGLVQVDTARKAINRLDATTWWDEVYFGPLPESDTMKVVEWIQEAQHNSCAPYMERVNVHPDVAEDIFKALAAMYPTRRLALPVGA